MRAAQRTRTAAFAAAGAGGSHHRRRFASSAGRGWWRGGLGGVATAAAGLVVGAALTARTCGAGGRLRWLEAALAWCPLWGGGGGSRGGRGTCLQASDAHTPRKYGRRVIVPLLFKFCCSS